MDNTSTQPGYHSHTTLDTYVDYATEAAFLWMLRSLAMDQAQYSPADIADLEQRLTTNLDALLSAPDSGWAVCEAALATGGAGEIFTALVVAIRSHNIAAIQRTVNAGLANDRACDGLVSALGWLPDHLARPWIRKFLYGKEMKHKYLGVAACSIRRFDPGDLLVSILYRQDCRHFAKLYLRAIRLAGELRRREVLPVIQAALSERNSDVRFWAAWSAILLGDVAQVKHLRKVVMHRGPYQEWAIQLAFRVLGVEAGREWINAMSTDKTNIRAVIKAIGVLGDPYAVYWLIGKMDDPLLARLAAEAFTFITGVELERNKLSCAPSGDKSLFVYDMLDETHVGIDEDENLPWPDVAKVTHVWRKYGPRFQAGNRYFMGKPITMNLLRAVLTKGSQRQRHAAALERALCDPQSHLINTRAKMLP